MAVINNPVMGPLQRILGLAPTPRGATVDTELVTLTMPIVPDISRRSLTHSESSGIFTAVLENVHSGADNERTTIDPYAVGVDLAQGAWPPLVDQSFDIWIYTAGITRVSGGELTGGQLRYDSNTFGIGFTSDDAGDPLSAASNQPVLATWAVFNTIMGSSTVSAAVIGTGELHARINQRIRRGFSLVFDSTSDAAMTCRLWMTLGLFPAGLGQDVAT